jgi:hypothetical protein
MPPKASQPEPVRRALGEDLGRSLARAWQEPGNDGEALILVMVINARRSPLPTEQPRLDGAQQFAGRALAVVESGRQLARQLTFIQNELSAVAADADVLAEVNHRRPGHESRYVRPRRRCAPDTPPGRPRRPYPAGSGRAFRQSARTPPPIPQRPQHLPQHSAARSPVGNNERGGFPKTHLE